MCWFHLKFNVRKHKHLLRGKYKQVLNHINSLHNTSNELEFRLLWAQTEKKWSKKSSMSDFHLYFKSQWIESIFSNGQIYQTPPGFSTTNNPVESYNATIKKFFTNRLKLNLVPALLAFKNDCIEQESSRPFEYAITKNVTLTQENKAKTG
jgi:hypothetical protein